MPAPPDVVQASTIDVTGLPRPEADPVLAGVLEAIDGLTVEASGLMAEVKQLTTARVAAEEQAVAGLANGDANGAREAEALAAQLSATLLEARGRLRAIGGRLGALEAERRAALAAASKSCSAAWADAERTLSGSLSQIEARATEIKQALAEVVSVRRRLDQVTGPGEPVAVKFVLPPRPYGVGEIATFPAGEAARLVARGQASYMDTWRRLAAGGTD